VCTHVYAPVDGIFNIHICFFSVRIVVMQIPNWFGGESTGATKGNPFTLPDAYMVSQHKNVCVVLIDLYIN